VGNNLDNSVIYLGVFLYFEKKFILDTPPRGTCTEVQATPGTCIASFAIRKARKVQATRIDKSIRWGARK
jgi:hypothetical protein